MVAHGVRFDKNPYGSSNGLAYNPDQDAEERRQIRREYRDLLNDDGDDMNDLVRRVERADMLFDNVKGTGEATLDSTLLTKLTGKQYQMARDMKSGPSGFDTGTFIERLITFMGGRAVAAMAEPPDESDAELDDDISGGPLLWERIGWRALAKSHRVPAMSFMLGPLSIEAKKRNVTKRSKLEKNKEDQRKPQEITEDDITRSENETTKNVATIQRILEAQGGPINIFRLVVNPNDFGQSVENLFYLSFLVRDGKCAFEIENGEPNIFICQQPTQEDYDGGLKKRQLVMELDMATWRRAIDIFNIKDPLVPQRPKAEMRIGGKWYG